MSDMVNHPSHYTATKYEVIDIIEEFTKGLTGIEAVCIGNVIKYVLRYQFKNGVEDLEKARWYLNKVLETKNATGGDNEPPVEEKNEDDTLYTWREYYSAYREKIDESIGGVSISCIPTVICGGVDCDSCMKMKMKAKEWEKLIHLGESVCDDGVKTRLTTEFVENHIPVEETVEEPVVQDARDIDKTLYTWKDFFLLHGDEARKLGGDRSTCVPNVVCAGVNCEECRKIVLTRREWEKLLTVPDGDRARITKVFAFEHSMDNYE